MQAVALVALVLTLALTAGAQAGSLVALGDSFSAGDGAPPYDHATTIGPRTCRRALYDAWPLRVGRELGHGVQHLACSGARTPEITVGLPRDAQPMRRVAQLDRIVPSPDVVTLTIGGNDLGFSRIVATCLALPACDDHYDRRRGDVIEERIARLAATLAEVYDQLRRKVGAPQVVVTGYPRLFPADGSPNCAAGGLLSVPEAEYLHDRTRSLNDAIETLVERAGFQYVDVTDAFDGYEMRCGHVGYVNPVPSNLLAPASPTPFHPTASGYRRLAEVVLEQVRL